MSLPLRRPNVFAGSYLDRNSRLRDDPERAVAPGEPPDALLVPVWQLRNLVERRADAFAAALLDWRQALPLIDAADKLILLGEFRSRLCFAFEIEGEAIPSIHAAAEFQDLRAIGAVLPGEEAGLLAYARAMVHWHSRHRYCGVCGNPTYSTRAGHLRICRRCGTQQFPRVDPAIIVLVSSGEGAGERALLGRQPSWPQGRYSTIAGFVEPGESLEDAVVREVLEETGIATTAHAYHSSQPWPFPASLMLGFTARALSADITCHDGELEDARWFSREDLASGAVLLPPPTSISYRLIDEWRRSSHE